MATVEELKALEAAIGELRGSSVVADATIGAALRWTPTHAERWRREWKGQFVARGRLIHLLNDNGESAANFAALNFTGSIDAALALVESALPGAEYSISTLYGVADVELPLNMSETVAASSVRRADGNVPLAILSALLAALSQEGTEA